MGFFRWGFVFTAFFRHLSLATKVASSLSSWSLFVCSKIHRLLTPLAQAALQNRNAAVEHSRRQLAQQSAAWHAREAQLLADLATSSAGGDGSELDSSVQAALAERKSLQESVTRLEAALVRAEEKLEHSEAPSVLSLGDGSASGGPPVMQALFDLASNALFIALVVSKVDGSLGMSLTTTKPPPGSSQSSGVSVKSVTEGGAAEMAGIRSGDVVRAAAAADSRRARCMLRVRPFSTFSFRLACFGKIFVLPPVPA